ncbi:type II secretion system major pseudopilin GspG [Novipirellula artificiosorum]|uniref:Type II secretion system core protein G n=1 Tax=Novipirellula artificiosorum TaxID=2528016 RepID=A0A5C6DP25_9BACT|nr:type II secretion system major pseudopilin GspG [Novipirellula artificiosorum]TWU38478.1 Type II secretion system protein G precursor [Novipirellula artificiosorum]
MKRKRKRSGFTLLELMIVLIILVGLIAMVGPRLLGSQQKADIRTAEVQIGNLASALKMYVVDMKVFPATEDGLEALLKAPDDERLARKWAGPYLDGSKLPIDPWGNDFVYEYDVAEGSSDTERPDFPRISSAGPDAQAGTDDDIANRPADGDEETTETMEMETTTL